MHVCNFYISTHFLRLCLAIYVKYILYLHIERGIGLADLNKPVITPVNLIPPRSLTESCLC